MTVAEKAAAAVACAIATRTTSHSMNRSGPMTTTGVREARSESRTTARSRASWALPSESERRAVTDALASWDAGGGACGARLCATGQLHAQLHGVPPGRWFRRARQGALTAHYPDPLCADTGGTPLPCAGSRDVAIGAFGS